MDRVNISGGICKSAKRNMITNGECQVRQKGCGFVMSAEKSTISPFTMIAFWILLFTHVVCVSAISPCHTKCSYIEQYQQADCEDRHLETVPQECNGASYLSLRYNLISHVEPGTFSTFPFLKYLILSTNKIAHIAANTFAGAPQLMSINLLYNSIQTFDPYALNGTGSRLRTINLRHNSLSIIHEGTFQQVPLLESIDLHDNSLSNLMSGAFQELKYLKRLYLGMNRLVVLPEDLFVDLSSLIYLDLSNNSISYIGGGLFSRLVKLETLDLSGNRLVTIGGALHLSNINHLDLSWNNLSHIDNLTLDALDNLELLYLEYNPWVCDCQLEPLRLWYFNLSQKGHDIITDSPVCGSPPDKLKLKIKAMNASLCELKPTIYNFPLLTAIPQVNFTEVPPDGKHMNKTTAIIILCSIFVLAILVTVIFCIYKKVVQIRLELLQETGAGGNSTEEAQPEVLPLQPEGEN